MSADHQPRQDEPTYQIASIVELTEDDPTNDKYEQGDVLIRAGNKSTDGVSHTVYNEDVGDFVDVECKVLGLLRADTEMTSRDLRRWATTIANEMDFMEKYMEGQVETDADV